jgi:hypothetical protein
MRWLREDATDPWTVESQGHVARRPVAVVLGIRISPCIQEQANQLRIASLEREDRAPQRGVAIRVARIHRRSGCHQDPGRRYVPLLAGQVQRREERIVDRRDVFPFRDETGYLLGIPERGSLVQPQPTLPITGRTRHRANSTFRPPSAKSHASIRDPLCRDRHPGQP